jgi:hypothetical protein
LLLQNFSETEVVQMPSRVVSFASLLLVVASVVSFLGCAWSVMAGRMPQGDGVLALAGWMLSAIVFGYRYADPKWLDPISIVKSR